MYISYMRLLGDPWIQEGVSGWENSVKTVGEEIDSGLHGRLHSERGCGVSPGRAVPQDGAGAHLISLLMASSCS